MILDEKIKQDPTAIRETLLLVLAASVMSEIIKALRDPFRVDCRARTLIPVLFHELACDHEHNL